MHTNAFLSFSFHSAIWSKIFTFSFPLHSFYEILSQYCLLLLYWVIEQLHEKFQRWPYFWVIWWKYWKIQKTWDFHEIMRKCPKVEPSFEGFSQFLLKVSIEMQVTIEMLFRNTWIFQTSNQLLCLFMSRIKSYKMHQCEL